MALSKPDEVGQMRRRRGTSTKRITKEKHLWGGVSGFEGKRGEGVGRAGGALTE